MQQSPCRISQSALVMPSSPLLLSILPWMMDYECREAENKLCARRFQLRKASPVCLWNIFWFMPQFESLRRWRQRRKSQQIHLVTSICWVFLDGLKNALGFPNISLWPWKPIFLNTSHLTLLCHMCSLGCKNECSVLWVMMFINNSADFIIFRAFWDMCISLKFTRSIIAFGVCWLLNREKKIVWISVRKVTLSLCHWVSLFLFRELEYSWAKILMHKHFIVGIMGGRKGRWVSH